MRFTRLALGLKSRAVFDVPKGQQITELGRIQHIGRLDRLHVARGKIRKRHSLHHVAVHADRMGLSAEADREKPSRSSRSEHRF